MPRIRIKVGEVGLELDGDEQFIAKYESAISMATDALKNALRESVAVRNGSAGDRHAAISKRVAGGRLPAFGSVAEALLELKRDVTDTDRLLLAGYFASRASGDGGFATGEANELLIEQGYKLSNPSQSIKNSLTAKRAFKKDNKWRLSRQGIDHLEGLFS